MEDYSAQEDVFTRLLPTLTLVALLEVFGALNADFTWWQNALALIGAVGLLVGAIAGQNALRGRGAFDRPARVGGIELALFVVVPPAVTGLIGGQLNQAL